MEESESNYPTEHMEESSVTILLSRPEKICAFIIYTFTIVTSLTLIIVILKRGQLRSDMKNWPLINYGVTTLISVVLEWMLDFVLLKNDVDPSRGCAALAVLAFGMQMVMGLSFMLMLIDRVDWCYNSAKHDKNMTPPNYIMTFTALWLLGLALGATLLFSVDTEISRYCVLLWGTYWRVYWGCKIVLFLALAIGIFTASLYKCLIKAKQQPRDETFNSLVVICILSAFCMFVNLVETITHVAPLYDYIAIYYIIPIYISVQLLRKLYNCIMPFVIVLGLKELRQSCCQLSEGKGETVPLLKGGTDKISD